MANNPPTEASSPEKLDQSKIQSIDNRDNISPKPKGPNLPKDEFSYTAQMISTDPEKRFEIEGKIDGRIVQDLISSTEKSTYFPRKVDMVTLL